MQTSRNGLWSVRCKKGSLRPSILPRRNKLWFEPWSFEWSWQELWFGTCSAFVQRQHWDAAFITDPKSALVPSSQDENWRDLPTVSFILEATESLHCRGHDQRAQLSHDCWSDRTVDGQLWNRRSGAAHNLYGEIKTLEKGKPENRKARQTGPVWSGVETNII